MRNKVVHEDDFELEDPSAFQATVDEVLSQIALSTPKQLDEPEADEAPEPAAKPKPRKPAAKAQSAPAKKKPKPKPRKTSNEVKRKPKGKPRSKPKTKANETYITRFWLYFWLCHVQLPLVLALQSYGRIFEATMLGFWLAAFIVGWRDIFKHLAAKRWASAGNAVLAIGLLCLIPTVAVLGANWG